MGRAVKTREEDLAIEMRYVQIEKLRKLLVRMKHYAKELSFQDVVTIDLKTEEFTCYMDDLRKVEKTKEQLTRKKRGLNYESEFKFPLLSTKMKKEFNELWKRYKLQTLY